MFELLAGLSGAVVVLLGSLFFSVRRTAKVRAQKDQAEAALDTIRNAHKASDAVIKQQEVDNEKQQDSIAQRHYFGD